MAVTHAAGRPHPDGTRMFHNGKQCRSQAARHGLVGFAARNTIRNDD
ncbi:hypothetical protein NK6_4246 [Bradyrhizobium diazoefficiens]|uniref:Uncharacterized protein n=1 Tax=Bradyrhizobium diazoefficiens TaxID=1355477 RepID=A0A0E3VUH4_9BRAD|nr:hypothetical protein NK6_4246 [Bradyrhizobium diazoefficiens]